jgi:hypothetical protein
MTQTPQTSPYDAEIDALEVGYWSVKANIRRITTLRDKREGYLEAMETVKGLLDAKVEALLARTVLARIFDNTL